MNLVLVRHGESEANFENYWTGWLDVDLTEKGIEQAKTAGNKIKNHGLLIDVAFESVLKRSIKTAQMILQEAEASFVPEYKTWRLNERHYGKLQGLNKKETAEKYGDEQVHIWRRSYDTLPPLMEATDEGSAANDRRYAMLDQRDIPGGENLKVTLERALPFWQDEIAPALKDNKTVLVAAHGNSLRALAKHIEGISDEDIMDLEIPTGKPLVYELNDDLTVKEKYYL